MVETLCLISDYKIVGYGDVPSFTFITKHSFIYVVGIQLINLPKPGRERTMDDKIYFFSL